jgi:hypothetical protein
METIQEFIRQIEKRIIVDKDNKEEIRFVKSFPATDDEIRDAERMLGIKLPESFTDFLKYCGPADFYGLQIWSLKELYHFDQDCGEMEGMIPFALDPFGRNHCFKPIAGSKEYPIYITSHDPFGYGKVADNFYEWCRLQNSMMLNFELDAPAFKHPFMDIDRAIAESSKGFKLGKATKWYEFWK